MTPYLGVLSTTGKARASFLDCHPEIGYSDPALYDILDAPTFMAAGSTTKHEDVVMEKLWFITERLTSNKDTK